MLCVCTSLSHAQAPYLKHYLAFASADTSEQILLATDAVHRRVYVAGSFANTLTVGTLQVHSRGDLDGFILALDTDLQPLWLRQFGGDGRDAATAISCAPNGDVLVGGYGGANSATATTYTLGNITYSGRGEADAVILRFDSDGDVEWSRNDGGANPDLVRNIQCISNDAIAVCGVAYGVARCDTVKIGSDNDLRHAYTQLLRADGNQSWVYDVVAIKTNGTVAATDIASFTRCTPLEFSALLSQTGSSVIAGDTLTEPNSVSQVLLRYSTADGFLSIDSVELCNNSVASWSSSEQTPYVTYLNDRDLCNAPTTSELRIRALKTSADSPFVHGRVISNSIGEFTSAARGHELLVTASFSDSCLVAGPTNAVFVNPNNTVDGLLICSDSTGSPRWTVQMNGSIASEITKAQGFDGNAFAVARAEGTLGILNNDGRTFDRGETILLAFADPVAGVYQAWPARVNDRVPNSTDLLNVYTVLGSQVTKSAITLTELRALPNGIYLLRWPKGLSLCYVDSYNIAFALPSAAQR